MSEQKGDSEQHEIVSPWPVVIALGLAVSEVGVAFGAVSIAVVGLIVLVGSVAGVLTEAGYTTRPWRVVGYLGVGLVALGGVIWFQGNWAVAIRGQSILLAGLICVGGGTLIALLPFVTETTESAPASEN